MPAVKDGVHTGTKEMLTSFVGDPVGTSVGLEDGCSEDREWRVSKCDVEVSSNSKSQDIDFDTSTCFDGDLVGTAVGLEEGETVGCDIIIIIIM